MTGVLQRSSSVPPFDDAARDRSRSPRQGKPWLFWRGKRATQSKTDGQKKLVELCPEAQTATGVVETEHAAPEDNMHLWAQGSGRADTARIKELMEQMSVADLEKRKMTAAFRCNKNQVEKKMQAELRAKKFPAEVIEAVIKDIGCMHHYRKMDSHFDHEVTRTNQRGKSQLYQYGIWLGEDANNSNIVDVAAWCITAFFRKGSPGPATKNELEGLKEFMEQELRGDILDMHRVDHMPDRAPALQNAWHFARLPPEQSMVAYARCKHNAQRQPALHEDDLINRMEIKEFIKYKTHFSFKCKRDALITKTEEELKAKSFPNDIIQAITAQLDEMESYKKIDEAFELHACDGKSHFYKLAVWCASAGPLGSEVAEMSMICTSASFRKVSDGPATKTEIEVLRDYLANESYTDVLRCYDPAALSDV